MCDIVNDIKEIIINNKILFLIVIFLILGIGFTLAYYIPHISSGVTGNVDVTAHTVDILNFEVTPTSKVSMEVDQFNTSLTGNSIKSKITAKAILKANSKTKTVTKKYSLYINIKHNNFIYTTGDAQIPENLVKITKNGVEIKEISGLIYKNVDNAIGGVQSGFDITTKTGLLPIVENQTITDDYSNPEATIDTWELEFIHVNLETDQFENAGKKMDAEVLIVKNELANFSGIIVPTVDEGTGLYHHTPDLLNGAGDNSYRYAGANPNNYICIGKPEPGSLEETEYNACTTGIDNKYMYRIIGVFDGQLKVIKNTSIGKKEWNSSENTNNVAPLIYNKKPYNYWQWIENGQTKKADLNRFLNDTDEQNTNGFYKILPESIKNKIDKDAKWYIDGISFSNSETYVIYEEEIKGSTITAPIGLMYVSDYLYAASDGWAVTLDKIPKYKKTNWLFLSEDILTITRCLDFFHFVFFFNSAGKISAGGAVIPTHVLPTFYLEANTKIISGNGMFKSPYQI